MPFAVFSPFAGFKMSLNQSRGRFLLGREPCDLTAGPAPRCRWGHAGAKL